ncbi:MAG: NUDIX domain-containing protein, partial [Actinobacteria bacterium]|nr:NUDIX domain-containing protein [Actinomycetota bacterium]
MSNTDSETRRNRVVLVDTTGAVIGEADKLAAHRDGGELHLAFSVFVIDNDGRVLLQRRAPGKYHFAGRWT